MKRNLQEMKIDLLKYELPIIAEYVGFKFFQKFLSSYLSWKIERKLKRYHERIAMKEYLEKKGFIL